jgi:hypothetical protein
VHQEIAAGLNLDPTAVRSEKIGRQKVRLVGFVGERTRTDGSIVGVGQFLNLHARESERTNYLGNLAAKNEAALLLCGCQRLLQNICWGEQIKHSPEITLQRDSLNAVIDEPGSLFI